MSIVSLTARREQTSVTPPRAPSAPADLQIHRQFRLLDLSGLQPIAAGAERLVYQHPFDPSLLVKVVDLPGMAEHLRTRPLRRWRKNRQREGPYRNHVAELAEYAAAHNIAAGRWKVPMARILGLAQTNMGLGLLVEKITDGQGGLAPTIEQIVRERGLDEALTRELDYFFDTLADHHIVLNDVSARNVVMGQNADGDAGLYLIDGFGSKQAVPLFAYSKMLNRRRILRKYHKVRAKLQARSLARAQQAIHTV
ncbi:YrbL family protein [Bordetella genomosp. 11]|uniref:PhoP regulatory network protein YrbL n=1 Tax=Bordetella genomosp. 11 TaxID=1416808 RepID=A0A261UIE0_9BORD|nr:YrbL family protein [Bordetella genomosp. 11]OZI61385.1 hypothetical protein CAL28_18940 [Bordetella genomosp. 11]